MTLSIWILSFIFSLFDPLLIDVRLTHTWIFLTLTCVIFLFFTETEEEVRVSHAGDNDCGFGYFLRFLVLCQLRRTAQAVPELLLRIESK